MLLLGAGGLGSPAALYLAAAGVGTLGIVDMDVVDASNLQRQILHNMDRIGERKVDSAKKTLTLLNPDVNVVTHDVRFGAENVMDIIDGYDVVLDGTDNFPTRYLLNDASLLARIPVVHGSIFRFEGQVTVFKPYEGPCYRCLLPEPPPPELAPSCAEAGVLGVLPGIVGSIQALETIKLLLDLGDPLIGRLLAYDALEQSFRTFKVRRDPKCPACGEDAAPIVIAEYDQHCLPHAVLADGSVLRTDAPARPHVWSGTVTAVGATRSGAVGPAVTEQAPPPTGPPPSVVALKIPRRGGRRTHCTGSTRSGWEAAMETRTQRRTRRERHHRIVTVTGACALALGARASCSRRAASPTAPVADHRRASAPLRSQAGPTPYRNPAPRRPPPRRRARR